MTNKFNDAEFDAAFGAEKKAPKQLPKEDSTFDTEFGKEQTPVQQAEPEKLEELMKADPINTGASKEFAATVKNIARYGTWGLYPRLAAGAAALGKQSAGDPRSFGDIYEEQLAEEMQEDPDESAFQGVVKAIAPSIPAAIFKKPMHRAAATGAGAALGDYVGMSPEEMIERGTKGAMSGILFDRAFDKTARGFKFAGASLARKFPQLKTLADRGAMWLGAVGESLEEGFGKFKNPKETFTHLRKKGLFDKVSVPVKGRKPIEVIPSRKEGFESVKNFVRKSKDRKEKLLSKYNETPTKLEEIKNFSKDIETHFDDLAVNLVETRGQDVARIKAKITQNVDHEDLTTVAGIERFRSKFHNEARTLYKGNSLSSDPLVHMEERAYHDVASKANRLTETILNRTSKGLGDKLKSINKDLHEGMNGKELLDRAIRINKTSAGSEGSWSFGVIPALTRKAREAVTGGSSELGHIYSIESGLRHKTGEAFKGVADKFGQMPLEQMGAATAGRFGAQAGRSPDSVERSPDSVERSPDSVERSPQSIPEQLVSQPLQRNSDFLKQNEKFVMAKIAQTNPDAFEVVQNAYNNNPDQLDDLFSGLSKMMPELFTPDKYDRFNGVVAIDKVPVARQDLLMDRDLDPSQFTAVMDELNRTGKMEYDPRK